jgi:hypothetical protein
MEEQKSLTYNQASRAQSVAIGGDECVESTQASTDVRNLIDLHNFGCNTNQVQTDEKQMNAVVDSKDMAS